MCGISKMIKTDELSTYQFKSAIIKYIVNDVVIIQFDNNKHNVNHNKDLT